MVPKESIKEEREDNGSALPPRNKTKIGRRTLDRINRVPDYRLLGSVNRSLVRPKLDTWA